MEQLLHFTWKHRFFGTQPLSTVTGEAVEVVDVGLHNHDAGPDFFNAKVKIDGQLLAGNVEIHLRASDWYAHRHHEDPAYDNVVLHIVGESDSLCQTCSGRTLPQMVLAVPDAIRQRYDQLRQTDHYPPCYQTIPTLSRLLTHSWMAALQTERLERKSTDIARLLPRCEGSWEKVWFVTLSRYFGFGLNSDAMEQWALSLPLQQVAHHRDNLFQIEAIFYGQAGLLQHEATSERHREVADADPEYLRFQQEYAYLRHKLQLHPIDYRQWRYLRLRPQNFPLVRLSQLAQLYFQNTANLSQMTDCETLEQLRGTLRTHATDYFQTHHLFGAESRQADKQLSNATIDILLINAAIPMLFAYGRHQHKEALCDRAIEFMEQLRPEDNHIVRMWRECGLEVGSAADSQALIQLKKAYCDRRDCLRCRFGFELLKEVKNSF